MQRPNGAPPRKWLYNNVMSRQGCMRYSCMAGNDAATKVILGTPLKSRKVLSRAEPAGQVNDFELIPTVRMESQHSIGTPTCHDFQRFVIISEKSPLEVGNRWQWSQFFGTKTPWGQIFTKLFRKDSTSHRTTSCVQISWNLAERKSPKPCVVYLTKKNKTSASSPALASARIVPKICQASSEQYTWSSENFIQIRSLPAEL